MKIDIKREFDKNEFLSIYNYKIKTLSKKPIFLYINLGIVFLLFVITLLEHNNSTVTAKAYGYSLSIILLLNARNYYVYSKRVKNQYRTTHMRRMNNLVKNNSELKLKLNDDEILYENFEISSKFKWSFIKSYFENEALIILIYEPGTLEGISILKKWLTEKENNELLNYCKENLLTSQYMKKYKS